MGLGLGASPPATEDAVDDVGGCDWIFHHYSCVVRIYQINELIEWKDHSKCDGLHTNFYIMILKDAL